MTDIAATEKHKLRKTWKQKCNKYQDLARSKKYMEAESIVPCYNYNTGYGKCIQVSVSLQKLDLHRHTEVGNTQYMGNTSKIIN